MPLLVIMVTDPQTNTPTNPRTGLITIHCATALLARSVINGFGRFLDILSHAVTMFGDHSDDIRGSQQ